MASLNEVRLIGYLGKTPEAKFLPDGKAVTLLSIATSEAWKDKGSGERKEHTEWHRVVLFGRLAEIACEYLKQGSSVFVGGHLRTRKWQDKSGADRYTTEIVGRRMQMLDRKQEAGPRNQESPPLTTEGDEDLSAFPPDIEDDIPF